MSRPVPLLDTLSKEAEAAGTLAGAQAYSNHLIRLLLGSEMGAGFVNAQARRLATADLLARRSGRGYVDERSVADAFNEVMRRAKIRGVGPPQTDSGTVHRLRLSISEIAPILANLKANTSSCLPSEAVFYFVLLISNNGSFNPSTRPGSIVGYRMGFGARPAGTDARFLLDNFLASHSRAKDAGLLDHLAQQLGF